MVPFVWLNKSRITQLIYPTTASWDMYWKEANRTISVVTDLFEYCSIDTLFTLPLKFWINKSTRLPTIYSFVEMDLQIMEIFNWVINYMKHYVESNISQCIFFAFGEYSCRCIFLNSLDKTIDEYVDSSMNSITKLFKLEPNSSPITGRLV